MRVVGSSRTVSISAAPASALEAAAAGLGSGESVDFSTSIGLSQEDVEWQTDFHHDAINGVIHLLGKPANANNSWSHTYYTLSTDSWTSPVNIGLTDSPGHIYGNSCLDERNGDLWLSGASLNAGSNRIERWRWSTKAWEHFEPLFNGTAGELNGIHNGLAFHPGLFTDGGVVIGQTIRTLYWNRATESGSHTSHSASEYGQYIGIGVYWPAQQAAYVGGSSPASGVMLKVTADGSGNPVETLTSAAPISLEGRTRIQPGFGSLHVHPGDSSKLLIVETAGGQRAWTSTDGNNWTAIANHPFDFEPRVVCSLRASMGCLWAVGKVGSTTHSMLWRPPI